MSKPDFIEMAREWLVRATGHARASTEQSLAAELEKLWELGIANAIEAAAPFEEVCQDCETGELVVEAIRQLTDKPADPRGN